MKSSEVIQEIRKAVGNAKAQGHSTISIKAFENYLDAFNKEIESDTFYSSLNHETQLAQFKAENDRNIAHANNENMHDIEMFKSVITAGQTALKSSMVINGGAAIALLAFTGKIWGSATSESIANGLTSSIFTFCAGVLLAAIAAGTTYLSQFSYASDWGKIGSVFNIVSIIFVLCSYVAFFSGSFVAAGNLGAHFGL